MKIERFEDIEAWKMEVIGSKSVPHDKAANYKHLRGVGFETFA